MHRRNSFRSLHKTRRLQSLRRESQRSRSLRLEPLEARNLLASFDVPILNFPGQEQDPIAAIEPPDTVGAVGPAHFVQMVNSALGSSVTIYDKDDGSLVSGPFQLSSLAPLDSPCFIGQGDPIAIYDQDADRFVLSEFGGQDADGNPNNLCVYISETSDPTQGNWDVYSFETQLFPDYPKFAFTGEHYIVTTNDVNVNSNPANFPAVYALDRENMLQGLPARPFQRVEALPLAGFGFQALTPANVDGPLPPSGTPALALRHVDDEIHFPSADPFHDFIEIYAFDIDFDDPTQTTFELAARVEVGEFDSDLCGGALDCIPQPSTDILLDALREVLMFRVQYRNFGTHESLVGNFTIDTGVDLPGIRWFELRKEPGEPQSAWTLYQEGTVAPPDNHARWMGSIAMDGDGNIALGYNISSILTSPKLVYTGRRAGDPLGVMTQGEITIVNGSGFFDSFANRWGDYNSMSIDPVDDSTFWFTGQYANNGIWATQIASFCFPGDGEPPVEPPEPGAGTISGTVWWDENGDGEIGNGENGPVEDGLPRFHIYADLDEDGRFDFGEEPVAVTDSDGNYTLPIFDLPADNTPIDVLVRPIFEPGWELTTPDNQEFIEVTIAADDAVTGIDFGYDLDLDMGSAPDPYPQATAGRVDGFQLGELLGVDDGFRIPGNVIVGSQNTAEFNVRTGGRPRGYVQMWMDFNRDGDWSDIGEQVILNERLGELPGDPWQEVDFTVPAGVQSGTYQTRVRFGYERFIGPSDPAQAGEIEDYEVTVFGPSPVAQDDFFQLPQGVDNEFLDVLDNDLPGINGNIRIVNFTQPGNGATVSLVPGGQGLRFTAPDNFFSPPVLTFEYTIQDQADPPNRSTATVEVFIEAAFDNPVAVDDSFIRTSDVERDPLPVLANDIPGTSPPVFISDITVDPVMGGTVEIDGDVIRYTPPSDTFVGTDTFQYEIRNSASPSVTDTAWVTIQVGDFPPTPTDQDKVIITLEVTDTDGDPLATTPVGSDFLLNVYVEDIRQPERLRSGVFAAFFDLLYDAKLTSLQTANNSLGFQVNFGPEYGEAPTGNPAVPNIIDEFGTFSTSDSPIGDGPFLLASIPMTAEAAGLAEFKADPADLFPESQTLLFETNTPVNSLTEIVYIFDDLQITNGSGGTRSLNLDTNNDNVVSPGDVLGVINFLNTNGPMPLGNLASGGEGESGGQTPSSIARLDANADNYISAADALVIINHLNGTAGGGEGEAAPADLGEGESAPVTLDVAAFGVEQEGVPVSQEIEAVEPLLVTLSTPPASLADDLPMPRVRRAATAIPAPTGNGEADSIGADAWAAGETDDPRADESSPALDALLGELAADVALAWRQRN